MSRVRNGTTKAEKLAAKGLPLPSAAVIGEMELQKWNDLLDKKAEVKQKDDIELRKVKHTMSQDRKKGWVNTVEGAHHAKDAARKRKSEEDEQRRKVIDAEEEELHVREKRAVVNEANRLLHQRDPRVVALNSQLLLHEVLQEREEQVSLSARKKQIQKERDEQYADSIIRAAECEKLEKQETALIARQKLVQLSKDRMAQLMEQKAQRAEEVHSARNEGQGLRELGDKAADEEVQGKLSARMKAREVAVEHKKQQQEKVARTNKKLDGLAKEDPVLEESNMKHAVRKAVQNQMLEEMLSARHAAQEGNRQLVLDRFEQPTAKKEAGVDIIMSGRSMETKVIDEDAIRSDKKKKIQTQCSMLDTQLAMNSARHQRFAENSPRRSNNALNTSKADAEFSKMRIAEQIEAMDQADRDAKMKERQDCLTLQNFHRLQANEKHVNDRAHEMGILAEGKEMLSLEEEENKMFNNYITSMMPGDMNYRLKKNAVKPPAPLRAA